MSASGYTAWSVTAGETPTTAYWNILGYNDASFNTGNGFNDAILIARHFGLNSVLSGSLGLSSAFSGGVTSYTPTLGATSGGTWSNPNGWYINLGGLKIAWGNVFYQANTTFGHCVCSQPSGFFSAVQIGVPAIMNEGGNAFQTASGDTFNTTNAPFYVNNATNGSSCVVSWITIGT